MIPQGLTDNHFRQAAAQIDRKGVPVKRKSVHYDLVISGKRYPPKYVVSLAARFATGKAYPAVNFDAGQAKNYFLARDYVVLDRRAEAEKIIVDEDDESNFPEGKERFRRHRDYERDSKIARKAKAKRLAKTGKLECEVCQLEFAQTYGVRGRGFIEAHHTTPVALLSGKAKTTVADLALVCSNCHRMLHRGKRLLSVSELRKIVKEQAERPET